MRHAQDRDAVVARRLVDVARSTLLEGEDICAVLDRVVDAMGDVAPSLEVGVILVDDGTPRLGAATRGSDRLSALFGIQERRGGPSFECLRTGVEIRRSGQR